jgi:hypothetical protein
MLLGLLGHSRPTAAQQAAKPLELVDCVKLMRADSVHMFFDEKYALVPPGCAVIRRESRIDAAGDFAGEIRDYLQADNGLRYRIHYSNGLRNGAYEQYHPNHQLAAQGQFAQGKPSGTWQFWYADGRPQQTLEWTDQAQPSVRILAYWDATGRQQVTAGTGTWEGSTGGSLPTRYGGRVAGGYQQGRWERHSLLDKQLLTAEEYQAGMLREGWQYIGTLGKPKKYNKQPLLEPALEDESVAAEPFHLGLSCEVQAAEKAASVAYKAALATLQEPQPPYKSTNFQRMVLERLHAFSNATQLLPRTDGQQLVVLADIDETGFLNHVTSESGPLASALSVILPELGSWQPAKLGGYSVPGTIRLTIRMYSSQLQSTLATNAAFPLPADIVQKAIQEQQRPSK